MNPPPAQETLYRGGTIVTDASDRETTDALLVRDGVVAALGAQAVAAASAVTEHVDLAGRTLVPGLIDAHCHPTAIAYLQDAADCSQPAAPDIRAIQERLTKAPVRADGWVTGSGFHEPKLVERRAPTRQELDEAVPHAPCVIYQTSLHTCVVNTAGLDALGLHDDTPDPPGGALGRAEDGRLNGSLLEAPMFDLITANMHRFWAAAGRDERVRLIARTTRSLADLGLTTVVDADTDRAGLEALREADEAGALAVRVRVLPAGRDTEWALEAATGAGWSSDRLWSTGVKFFADGGMSSRTAAVDEPYEGTADQCGLLLADGPTLADRMRPFHDAGLQVCVHAQGERAIRATLDALERLGGTRRRRHRIEHGGAFTPDLIERAAALGVCVVSQPGFLPVLGDGFIDAFGARRAQSLYPFRSLRRAGVVVAGSSDAPVIGADPMLGLRGATERRTDTGREIGPDEALTAWEWLALYTTAAAWVNRADMRLGMLTAGRPADLTILPAGTLQ